MDFQSGKHCRATWKLPAVKGLTAAISYRTAHGTAPSGRTDPRPLPGAADLQPSARFHLAASPVPTNPLLLHPTGKAPRDAPCALLSHQGGSPCQEPTESGKTSADPTGTPRRGCGKPTATVPRPPGKRQEASPELLPAAAPPAHPLRQRSEAQPARGAPAAAEGTALPRRRGDTPIRAETPRRGLSSSRRGTAAPTGPSPAAGPAPAVRGASGPLPRGYLPGTSCVAVGGRSSPPPTASPAPASAPAPGAAAAAGGRRPRRAGAVERPPWCYRCSAAAARLREAGEAGAPGVAAARACAPRPPGMPGHGVQRVSLSSKWRH